VSCALGTLLFGAVWTTNGTDTLLVNLDKLQFQNVSINQSGTVVLAPALTKVAALDETAVWQLASSPGNLEVATGNQARVYRLTALGSQRTVFDGTTGEVLCIITDSQGNSYFGTTPEGKVYRYRPGAAVQPVADLKVRYIFSLLAAPDCTILCATGDQGQLYRLRPPDPAQLLFTANQAHLTALAWLVPGKELLVGTSPEGLLYRLTLSPTGTVLHKSVFYDTPLEEVRAIVVGANRVFIAANSSADEGGESTATVFILDTLGISHGQWRCPDSAIFSLHWHDGQLLIGSGNRGIIYALDTLGRASVWHKLPSDQVLCFLPVGNEVWLGTANSAGVYRMARLLADSGYLSSWVFDCGNPARFGRLDYRARVPEGTELFFDTRSGNCGIPDSTWSDWTPVQGGLVKSPAGRFIQWRARLYSHFPNLTPALHRIDLFYQPANLAPVITRLTVPEVSWDEARKGVSRPNREITWEASDPTDDSLAFELYFKGETERQWQRLASDLAEAKFELDTRSLPDGWYQVKLIASDRPTRGPENALASELVSLPFLVDNTAPAVKNLRIVGNRVTMAVTDDLSSIVACRVAVNAGPWMAVEPQDGLFDSPEETFAVKVQLAAGENTIAVWAADAQGNVGAGRLTVGH